MTRGVAYRRTGSRGPEPASSGRTERRFSRDGFLRRPKTNATTMLRRYSATIGAASSVWRHRVSRSRDDGEATKMTSTAYLKLLTRSGPSRIPMRASG